MSCLRLTEPFTQKGNLRAYPFLMKRISLFITLILLLSACGQSNEERAKELVAQACALEGSDGYINTDAEPLIRQAVELDEKYRAYLIGWLKWEGGNREQRLYYNYDADLYEQATRDFNEGVVIVRSFCDW
jgi:hypothetical protein